MPINIPPQFGHLALGHLAQQVQAASSSFGRRNFRTDQTQKSKFMAKKQTSKSLPRSPVVRFCFLKPVVMYQRSR